MTDIYIHKYGFVDITDDMKWRDISDRPNERFGRYDPLTKAALAAVEQLNLPLDQEKDPTTALLLCSKYGCLAVDYHYLKDKQDNPPSPTLFTYTLPSVALGEIAIRYRITGANLTILSSDIYCRLALLESCKQLIRQECQQLILIIADGLSPQISPLIDPLDSSHAMAMQLSLAPLDQGLKLSMEKFGKNSIEILPKEGLLDYVSGAQCESWVTLFNYGKNSYKLTLANIS